MLTSIVPLDLQPMLKSMVRSLWYRLADQVAFLRSFGSRKERNERFLLAAICCGISVIFFDFQKKFKGDYINEDKGIGLY